MDPVPQKIVDQNVNYVLGDQNLLIKPTQPEEQQVTPPPIQVIPEQFGDSWYTDARIDGRNEVHTGLLLVPVAGPEGTPPELIRVSAPYAKRVIEFAAERPNDRPMLPSWNTNNPNEVLAYRSIVTATPAMAPGGSRIYRTQGRYVYYLGKVPSDTSPIPVGTPQYDLQPAALNNILPSDFSISYVDSSSTFTG